MLPSVVDIFDNATRTRRRAPLLAPPPSTTISNRKCRCVQHRHPERPTGVEGSPPNRKSGIRNQNNRRLFRHFHFPNRKYLAISLEHPATNPSLQIPWSSSVRRLIETPRLKLRINHALSITSNFLIETKWVFSILSLSVRVPHSAFPHLLASLCPNLRVSVPPWPIFAIMAGFN